MVSLRRRKSRTTDRPAELERGWLSDAGMFRAPGGRLYSMMGSASPTLDNDFAGLVESVGRCNGVVNAAVFARSLMISQTRFQWRRRIDREMFGSTSLALLEHPAMMSRPQFFALAEEYVSYGGTAYFWRNRSGDNKLRLLRPDWVDVAFGSKSEPGDVDSKRLPLDAEVIGYEYKPGGRYAGGPSTLLRVEDVAAWSPNPDPVCTWRGQSWITALVRDIALDQQAEHHVEQFFENAATPNVVYSMSDKLSAAQLTDFTEAFRNGHEGAENAWRSVIVGGGADVTVVGSSVADLGLKDLRGGIESKIASASRIPAVILGIREGMQGSALNAGNYASQRRQLADGWFSPTTQGLAAVLDPLVDRPGGGSDIELWPDARDVLFLQEDAKDASDILSANVQAIRQGVDAGFDPDALVEMAMNGSLSPLLGAHTGLTSVQLTPPVEAGTETDDGGSEDDTDAE